MDSSLLPLTIRKKKTEIIVSEVYVERFNDVFLDRTDPEIERQKYEKRGGGVKGEGGRGTREFHQ